MATEAEATVHMEKMGYLIAEVWPTPVAVLPIPTDPTNYNVRWSHQGEVHTATMYKAYALMRLKDGKGNKRSKCIKHSDCRLRLDVDCDGVFPYDVAINPYIECGR